MIGGSTTAEENCAVILLTDLRLIAKQRGRFSLVAKVHLTPRNQGGSLKCENKNYVLYYFHKARLEIPHFSRQVCQSCHDSICDTPLPITCVQY